MYRGILKIGVLFWILLGVVLGGQSVRAAVLLEEGWARLSLDEAEIFSSEDTLSWDAGNYYLSVYAMDGPVGAGDERYNLEVFSVSAGNFEAGFYEGLDPVMPYTESSFVWEVGRAIDGYASTYFSLDITLVGSGYWIISIPYELNLPEGVEGWGSVWLSLHTPYGETEDYFGPGDFYAYTSRHVDSYAGVYFDSGYLSLAYYLPVSGSVSLVLEGGTDINAYAVPLPPAGLLLGAMLIGGGILRRKFLA